MAKRPSNPWDRLDGETPPAWQAFTTYRDMGPARSLHKVAQELSKSDALMKRWSAEHAWVLRASAWDAEQDRMWQVTLRASQRKAVDRNVKLATDTMSMLAKAVSEMAAKVELFKPSDIARLMDSAVRLEAAAYAHIQAAPVGGDGLEDVDLDSLTDEEIRVQMLALRRELDAELEDYPDLDDEDDAGAIDDVIAMLEEDDDDA